MEFASDANGVQIAAQRLQLHLQFNASRWMFLLQHHEEDLLWEPLLQPALEVGDRLEQGWQEHPGSLQHKLLWCLRLLFLNFYFLLTCSSAQGILQLWNCEQFQAFLSGREKKDAIVYLLLMLHHGAKVILGVCLILWDTFPGSGELQTARKERADVSL